MGALTDPHSATSQGEKVLSFIRTRYPGYHPLMAIAELAHATDADPKLQLDCHKTIAKYVQPELRSIDVKGTITETRRVIVSLFDEGELSEDGKSRSVTYGSSAPAGLAIEGAAMTLLESPSVTVAEDPMWDVLMSIVEQEAA
jgi:hypothetical protein